MTITPQDPGARSAGKPGSALDPHRAEPCEPRLLRLRFDAAQQAPTAATISQNPWRHDPGHLVVRSALLRQRHGLRPDDDQGDSSASHTGRSRAGRSSRSATRGVTVTVPVVDRGPYIAGRTWDLTSGACVLEAPITASPADRCAWRLAGSCMRILVIGAGGVGSASSRSPPARLLRAHRRGRLRPRRAERAIARGRRRRAIRRARVDASRAGRSPPCAGSTDQPRPERRRPALRHADLRWRLRGGRRLPRHGDVAVAAASRAAPRADRREARRRAVRRGRPGRRPGRLALVGIGVEPGLSDVFARYAQDHLFTEIDESASATAPTSSSMATTSRPRSRSGRRSRSASTRRSSGRRSAAGTRRRRSASRRCSTSRRASARSSA